MRMNGCRFLASLGEVQNSKRILQYRSLLQENINFWDKDPTSENLECVTVTEDMKIGTRKIVENILNENSVEVSTWYVVKKFKRSR